MPARTVWRYPQYAAHARWELLRAAGVAQDKLIASGVGPVTPENTSGTSRSCAATTRCA
ncbi:hypothetical protein [Nocardia farcinica]|uniref:Uncharacterized protein n=1 Tax=Nocardia farcinica (strain IFM 10152) TaxID=247156 RepID=Q5YU08_NOCFA|nr:hypothetical protein [Nocardia farcinica]BAD58333.1 hypothetical protein NFA_34850 [Nocardia farcinica IFM 10152]